MSSADILRVIIAGGGTGGHLFPALAIGSELQNRVSGAKILYVGSRFGIEAKVLPEKGLDHTLLPIRGLQRTFSATGLGRNLLFPLRIIRSYTKAKTILKEFNPHIVIGTGGYASGMPLLAAVRNDILTLIQEQNSYPGATTRNLAGKVNRVCLAFEESTKYMPAPNWTVTGNPVRQGIASGDRKAAAKLFDLSTDKKTVFIFGGSQGSAVLNSNISQITGNLNESGIQVLWQTGTYEFDNYREWNNNSVRVIPFISEMEQAYALSDLVICRAGALTIAELTVCGKPAVFVPLPSAAADHQMKNARSLEKDGAAIVIDEADLNPEALEKSIIEIINNPGQLQTMSEKSKALAKPKATEKIVDLVLKLAKT